MNTRTDPTLSADTDIARLRVPPHSNEAEQSVLGGLLLDNSAWARAGSMLSNTDFYCFEHQAIFAVIGDLINANKPADVITVFERLQAAGRDGEIGGIAYLNSLAHSVPSAANLRRYAEIVRERAVQRRIIATCDTIATAAFTDTGAQPLLDMASAAFGQLERAGQRVEPQSIDTLLVRAIDRYTELAEGKRAPGIPTGIGPVDRLLNGLQPGKAYYIGARPSVGKSSAGRYIGLNAARLGHPVLLLSQEMPCDEVTDCVVAQVAGIDSERVQTGQFEHDDWRRLADAADDVRGWPLYVDEQGGLRLSDIRAKARSIKGLRVLILDYLQLSRSTLKNATTNDQIAEISKGLKALAMEMKVAVVVLSQLNREVEKRADREPQLSDLRDSGAIEQDADAVVLLWTVREDDGVNCPRLVGWKVAKHRCGRKGRFGMLFDAPRYQWHETGESISPSRSQERAGGSL